MKYLKILSNLASVKNIQQISRSDFDELRIIKNPGELELIARFRETEKYFDSQTGVKYCVPLE